MKRVGYLIDWVSFENVLQFFDAVGWVSVRAFSLQKYWCKLSPKVSLEEKRWRKRAIGVTGQPNLT